MAESSLLGNILLNESVLDMADVAREDFEQGGNKLIFECISNMRQGKMPVDLVSVVNQLAELGKLDAAGGVMHVSSLVDNASGSEESTLSYAKILRGLRHKRDLLRECKLGIEIVNETKGRPVDEVIGEVQSRILKIGQCGASDYADMSSLTGILERQIEEAIANPGEVTGVPCGLMDLDRMTGGFQDTNLIIVAGRPGMGKSTFMCNLVDGAASLGYPAGVQSLEMSKEELGYRLISKRTDVSFQRMRNGMLDGQQVTSVVKAMADIRKLPLYIDDTGSLRIDAILRNARRMKREHDIRIFVVDYLQKIKGDSDDRRIIVGDAAQALKDLAKELRIPVVALAQLNRSVEFRDDKRPMMSDLKESGDIEQEADIIIFLYRDEYYNPDSEYQGILEVNFAKYRNGSTGRVKLAWNGKAQRIENLNK